MHSSLLDFDGLDGVLTSRVRAVAQAAVAPTVLAEPFVVEPAVDAVAEVVPTPVVQAPVAVPNRAWLGLSAGVLVAVALLLLGVLGLGVVGAIVVATGRGRPTSEPVAVPVAASPEPIAAPVAASPEPIAVPEPLPAPWVVPFGFDAAAPLETKVPAEFLRCTRLAIVGHTDDVGTAEVNRVVGLQRAEAVRTLLIGAGVPGDHLTVESAGESAPIESNETRTGRRANRRVVVTCNP